MKILYDALGKEIQIGDCVACAISGKLNFGVVEHINVNRLVCKMFDKKKNSYIRNIENVYVITDKCDQECVANEVYKRK